MRERAGFLDLITEMRGRLDELERMVRTAPNHSILSPVSYDEDGVVNVTPQEYAAFRSKGLDEPVMVHSYEPVQHFLQFGSPDVKTAVAVSSFELSDLHRTGPEPAYGVRLAPQTTATQAWFTYELLMSISNATEFVWLEWVVKLSFDQQTRGFLQFIVEGDGYSEPVDVGPSPFSDFASFKHVRLDRNSILQASAGRNISRIRLTFSTGGVPVPMTIYAWSVFGRL